MPLFKRLLSLSLCLAALLLSACGTASAPAPEAPSASPVETPAPTPSAAPVQTPAPTPEPAADWNPDFTFRTTDMNGDVWTDECFAEHALTIINLWAYWCGPCVGEMPDLQRLSEEYADRGVQILGLYNPLEEEDDRAAVERLGVSYPCLRFVEEFGPYVDTGYIPVTIFIDGSGKVLSDEPYVGSRSYEGWSSIIEGYLT